MFEHADESNVLWSDEDGGCCLNISDKIVVLESVTLDDLIGFWAEFEARVRHELLLLFRMPFSEIKMRFGDLGLKFGRDEQSSLPFGLIHTSGRLINLRKKAVTRAMVELGLFSERTARNRRRTRASEGRLEDAILLLDRDKQLMIVDRVMQYGIEDALFPNQGDDLGWEALIARLIKSSSATEILEFVSEEFTNFCELTSPAAAGLSKAKGTRRVFAPYWFAMFLAARHVWLLPKTCLPSLHRAYPRRWMPLLPLLATPPECKDIAGKVLKLYDGTKETHRNCPVVFALSALSSTMWSSRRFCPWPLHELRLQLKATGELGVATTGSINRIYDFLAKEFNIDMANRIDSGVYYGKKKHFTAGRPFVWCFSPTPQNTRLVKRCIGEEISYVPQSVRDVAEELIFVVNQLTVKNLTGATNALDLWLIFLMSLNPSDAPRSLREINRHVHVNSLNDEDPTFVNFLKKHFHSKGKDVALKAVSQLHHAWQLCATKDGYHQLSNPFDTKIDKPFKHRKRAARTARPALEKRVVDKLFEINCRNDFELARNLGDRHFRMLKHPVTGEVNREFWPAVPICVGVTMLTGIRLRTARWLDSGEGDEQVWDPVSLTTSTNSGPGAIKGRSQAFLRPFYLDARSDPITGIFINSSKSGPYQFEYCRPELIPHVLRMKELAAVYFPMERPVRAVDAGEAVTSANRDQFAEVFPLFRDGRDTFHRAIYDEECRAYFRELIRYSKPEIDELVGYDYPLLDLEGSVLKVHDLRATTATNMLDAGMSPEMVQRLLGQSSVAMAVFYWAKSATKTYEQMQSFHDLSDTARRAAEGDKVALLQLAVDAEKHEVSSARAVNVVRSASESSGTAPLDFFMHGCCTGDCDTGGPAISGKPGPVWRPRACSECIHRLTGPAFLLGIKIRVNALGFEIRTSLKRSAEFNAQMEETEQKTGRPDRWLRKCVAAEERLRAKLEREYSKEYINLMRCSALKSAAENTGADPSKILLRINQGENVEVGLDMVSEFELKHRLMADVKILPGAVFDLPGGLEESWRSDIQMILRANRMDDILLSIPDRQKVDCLLAMGDLLLGAFGEPSKFQVLMEQSAAGEASLLVQRMTEALRGAANLAISQA